MNKFINKIVIKSFNKSYVRKFYTKENKVLDYEINKIINDNKIIKIKKMKEYNIEKNKKSWEKVYENLPKKWKEDITFNKF